MGFSGNHLGCIPFFILATDIANVAADALGIK